MLPFLVVPEVLGVLDKDVLESLVIIVRLGNGLLRAERAFDLELMPIVLTPGAPFEFLVRMHNLTQFVWARTKAQQRRPHAGAKVFENQLRIE